MRGRVADQDGVADSCTWLAIASSSHTQSRAVERERGGGGHETGGTHNTTSDKIILETVKGGKTNGLQSTESLGDRFYSWRKESERL